MHGEAPPLLRQLASVERKRSDCALDLAEWADGEDAKEIRRDPRAKKIMDDLKPNTDFRSARKTTMGEAKRLGVSRWKFMTTRMAFHAAVLLVPNLLYSYIGI